MNIIMYIIEHERENYIKYLSLYIRNIVYYSTDL